MLKCLSSKTPNKLNRSTESISVFAIFNLGITTFFCGIQNTINLLLLEHLTIAY